LNSQKAGYEPALENHIIKRTPRTGPEPVKITRPTENRHLAKRVAEAEKQLEYQAEKHLEQQTGKFLEYQPKVSIKQPKESIKQTNSQTEENLPFEMGNKTMITPGARDAPKFSAKRPQELRRFVRQMEDLWKDAGITDDEEMKESLGKYADQESEEEWKALETYERGTTWKEFREELLMNYPEAAEAERGTPARIKRLCKETLGIRLGDLAALYSFRRAFMAEAKKLTKPPAVVSNRELVELFIGSLSEPMAAAVLQFLGSRAGGNKSVAYGKTIEKAVNTQRRPEDKYDLEEVCKAAIQVSESSQGMFYLMNNSSPEATSERRVTLLNQPVLGNTWTQKLEEIENTQAAERDKLDIANKNMDTRFNELENMMKTLLAQVQGGNTGIRKEVGKPGEPNVGIRLGNPGTIPKWGAGGRTTNKCFYCGGDHFIPECDEVKEDVKNGLVKLNMEGKIRLSDGGYIPNISGATTIKERVDRHYAKKNSQYYLGNEEEEDVSVQVVSRLPAQYTTAVEDPVRRKARLEYELDLKEREEALELRQLKLEREEKKKEQNSKSTRAAHVLEMLEQLTEDELSAIKTSKTGF
jgi:hypothetical protein